MVCAGRLLRKPAGLRCNPGEPDQKKTVPGDLDSPGTATKQSGEKSVPWRDNPFGSFLVASGEPPDREVVTRAPAPVGLGRA